IAIAPECIKAMLIGHDQYDIGSLHAASPPFSGGLVFLDQALLAIGNLINGIFGNDGIAARDFNLDEWVP
ncbi:MAG: hypothetical protein K0Q73_8897, partial [Paenibacillus sp.]|nr:hypothetical protein [Paenibacillus sp.]